MVQYGEIVPAKIARTATADLPAAKGARKTRLGTRKLSASRATAGSTSASLVFASNENGGIAMGNPKMLGFSKPLPHNTRQGKKAPWQGGKKKIIPPRENTCVCCGEIIPEGRQVCPRCDREKGLTRK